MLTIDPIIFVVCIPWYKRSAGVRGGGRETHQGRPFQGIIGLKIPINFTSLDEQGNDLPNLLKADCGASYCWGISPTGESVPQAEAAALTRPKTSFINGRRVRWVCQQSSNSFQTLSEIPSSSALSGFDGLPPSTTLNTTSDPDNFPNGSVPVSTYPERINIHVRRAS